jgi:hypothetical protein
VAKNFKYLIDTAKYFKDVFDSFHDKPTSRNQQDEITEVAIHELRRRYDKIGHDYDTTRIKLLTLFGGTLAFLSFLYSGRTKQGKADIFFPPNLDERILYFIGLGLVLGALFILFWSIKPSDWALPLDAKVLSRLEDNYTNKSKFLAYVNEEYLDTISFCMGMLAKKIQLLGVSINMLFMGAIILLVLKYFGG